MLKILILISCFVFNSFSELSVHVDYHTLINGEFRSCAGFNSIKTDRRGLTVKLRNGHSLGSTKLSVGADNATTSPFVFKNLRSRTFRNAFGLFTIFLWFSKILAMLFHTAIVVNAGQQTISLQDMKSSP